MISLFPKEVTYISKTVVANIGLRHPISRGVTRFVIVREAARRTSYKSVIKVSVEDTALTAQIAYETQEQLEVLELQKYMDWTF
ncbi:hypothetical protein Tco_1389424 [Tanacetum coccineum]